MISKRILIPVIAVTIAGASAFAGVGAYAQTPADPLSGLSDVIAQKFGLDKNQVQTVVEDYHNKKMEEKKQVMQKRIEEKLTQDVKDGNLTEAQKQAILKKFEEQKNSFNPESLKNMTVEERRKTMENKRAELKSWAESQGIDPSYLMFKFGRGLHKQGWAKP